MPRESRYYEDMVNVATGHRERVVIIPAGAGGRTVGTPPEFGDSPGEGSVWKRLPAGFFKSASAKGGASYDKLLVGLPDPPKREFKVDLAMLAGDLDWEDLATYLANPILPAGDPDGAELTLADDHPVECVNTILVMSDMGSGSGISSFAVDYCGTQARRPEEPIEYNEVSGEHLHTFETTHVLRTIFETLKPADLVAYLDGVGLTERTMLYNLCFIRAGITHFHAYGTDPAESDRQVFSLLSMASLLTGVRELAEELLGILVGGTRTLTFDTPSGFWADMGPFSTLQLFSPAKDWLSGAHDDGDTLSGMHVVAWVHLSSNSSVKVSGYLHESRTADGLYKYSNLWDWLSALTESTACRARITHVSAAAGGATNVTMTFGSAKYPTTYASATDGDISNVGRKVTLRKNLVSGARCDVTGTLSKDWKKITHTVWGVATDPKRTVPVVFHTSPCLGELNDYISIASESGFNSDLTGDCIGIITTDVPCNLLWSLEGISSGTQNLPMRPHHYVKIRTAGATDYATPCQDALLFAAQSAYTTDKEIIKAMWKEWRKAILGTVQPKAGIPFAATWTIGQLFSQALQYGITAKVPYGVVTLNDLGKRMAVDISAFPASGSYLSEHGDDPFILSMDRDGGDVVLELLAPG